MLVLVQGGGESTACGALGGIHWILGQVQLRTAAEGEELRYLGLAYPSSGGELRWAPELQNCVLEMDKKRGDCEAEGSEWVDRGPSFQALGVCREDCEMQQNELPASNQASRSQARTCQSALRQLRALGAPCGTLQASCLRFQAARTPRPWQHGFGVENMTIPSQRLPQPQLGVVFDLFFDFDPPMQAKAALAVRLGVATVTGPLRLPSGEKATPLGGVVAVVRISCSFPGVDSPEKSWQLLAAGQMRNRRLPPQRLAVTSGIDWWLGDVGRWDAGFFGVHCGAVRLVDLNHRYMFKLASGATENAAINPQATSGSAQGFYVGVFSEDCRGVCRRPELVSSLYFGTALSACAAPAVAHGLDLGPDTEAQQSLVVRTVRDATGWQGSEVAYFDLHDNITVLNDLLVVNAITSVLGESQHAALLVMFVKANIGRTSSKAGMASLIQVLRLQAKQDVQSPNLHTLKPALLQRHMIYCSTEVLQWPNSDSWHCVTFGVSGTNAQVLVSTKEDEPGICHHCDHVFNLSKCNPSLMEMRQRQRKALKHLPRLDVADYCATSNLGRSLFELCMAVVSTRDTLVSTHGKEEPIKDELQDQRAVAVLCSILTELPDDSVKQDETLMLFCRDGVLEIEVEAPMQSQSRFRPKLGVLTLDVGFHRWRGTLNVQAKTRMGTRALAAGDVAGLPFRIGLTAETSTEHEATADEEQPQPRGSAQKCVIRTSGGELISASVKWQAGKEEESLEKMSPSAHHGSLVVGIDETEEVLLSTSSAACLKLTSPFSILASLVLMGRKAVDRKCQRHTFPFRRKPFWAIQESPHPLCGAWTCEWDDETAKFWSDFLVRDVLFLPGMSDMEMMEMRLEEVHGVEAHTPWDMCFESILYLEDRIRPPVSVSRGAPEGERAEVTTESSQEGWEEWTVKAWMQLFVVMGWSLMSCEEIRQCWEVRECGDNFLGSLGNAYGGHCQSLARVWEGVGDWLGRVHVLGCGTAGRLVTTLAIQAFVLAAWAVFMKVTASVCTLAVVPVHVLLFKGVALTGAVPGSSTVLDLGRFKTPWRTCTIVWKSALLGTRVCKGGRVRHVLGLKLVRQCVHRLHRLVSQVLHSHLWGGEFLNTLYRATGARKGAVFSIVATVTNWDCSNFGGRCLLDGGNQTTVWEAERGSGARPINSIQLGDEYSSGNSSLLCVGCSIGQQPVFGSSSQAVPGTNVPSNSLILCATVSCQLAVTRQMRGKSEKMLLSRPVVTEVGLWGRQFSWIALSLCTALCTAWGMVQTASPPAAVLNPVQLVLLIAVQLVLPQCTRSIHACGRKGKELCPSFWLIPSHRSRRCEKGRATRWRGASSAAFLFVLFAICVSATPLSNSLSVTSTRHVSFDTSFVRFSTRAGRISTTLPARLFDYEVQKVHRLSRPSPLRGGAREENKEKLDSLPWNDFRKLAKEKYGVKGKLKRTDLTSLVLQQMGKEGNTRSAKRKRSLTSDDQVRKRPKNTGLGLKDKEKEKDEDTYQRKVKEQIDKLQQLAEEIKNLKAELTKTKSKPTAIVPFLLPDLVDKDEVARGLAQPFLARTTHLTELDDAVLSLQNNSAARTYLTVFQSSGTGKTKWALSLKERDLAHVVYLHLSRIDPSYQGNGFPNPNPLPLMKWAFEFAPQGSSWRRTVDRLKVMIVLIVSRSCAAFTEQLPSECPDMFTYQNQRREANEDEASSTRKEGQGVQYSSTLQGIKEDDWENCDVDNCLRGIADFRLASQRPVVVVWDEAATLSQMKVTVNTDGKDPPDIPAASYVLTARTAMIVAIDELAQRYFRLKKKESGKKINVKLEPYPFVHVFIATTSGARLADASLGSQDDSLRFLKGELPLPVTGFKESIDIAMKNHTHCRKQMCSMPRQDIDVVARYGRPLWSTIKPFSEKLTWTESVGRYAGLKLLGGALQEKATWDNLTNEEFLAVVMSRIAGFTVPIHQAEHLVRSHMAFATNVVSHDRIQAGYISEPMLSGGSKLLSAKLGGYGSAAMMRKLVTCFSASPISAGDIGEIAAVIVLLKAMDTCCEKSESEEKLFPACSLAAFLDVLLGPEWRKKIHSLLEKHKEIQPDKFFAALDARFVSFNHFFRVGIDERSWPTLLSAAYRRCGAIICQEGYHALDLVIPTVSESNQYSGVLIQVRNTKDYFEKLSLQETACVFPFEQPGVVPGLSLGLRMVKGKERRGRAGVIVRKACGEEIVGKTKQVRPAVVADRHLVGYVASSSLDLACLTKDERDALEQLCGMHRDRHLNPLHKEDGFDSQVLDRLARLDCSCESRQSI